MEILGQSKNPEAVQPHLKKCFDNINKLKMAKVGELRLNFLARKLFDYENYDLLEILGQSKNPEAVQPHLKKCFDNINKLKMAKVRKLKLTSFTC